MKNAAPIAVASRSFSKHPLLRQELMSRYSDVIFNEEGTVLSGPGLIKFLQGRVKAITGLEIIRQDERFTSAIAHRTQRDMNVKKKDRRSKEDIDIISAALILQSYLDEKTAIERRKKREAGGSIV